ncbi:MAG TPA: GNAT family N-acetyltransferase [Jiangellales bacterium]|nr:GNAT family N-acetyltransferase [Jiangellales bacterium]
MSERGPDLGPARSVRLERLGPADWRRWREVRLIALRDAPTSFASTYEQEAGRSEQDWRDWLHPDRGLKVLARSADGELAGIVGGWEPPEVPGAVELYSMWVAPAARGRGVGDLLVREVLAWAAEIGATEVLLWVTRANAAAHALYERHGFRDTGREEPLPSHPCETERAMRLTLGQAPAAR